MRIKSSILIYVNMFNLLCQYCGNVFQALRQECPKCKEKKHIIKAPKSLEKIDTYPKKQVQPEKKEPNNDDYWYGSFD